MKRQRSLLGAAMAAGLALSLSATSNAQQPKAAPSEPANAKASSTESQKGEPPIVRTSQLDEVLEQVDRELAAAPSEADTIQAAVAWLPALAAASVWWRRKSEKERERV